MKYMKKELNYFRIDGGYGGNQEWFSNLLMYMGGCAAATACDSCIYLAREMGMTELYPYDAANLTRDDYIAFAMKMKPFLRPRMSGINRLDIFIDGFGQYLHKTGNISLQMEEFQGHRRFEEAVQCVKRQIDAGYPIPYLMLRHTKPVYKDFVWHWFLAVGYEETADDLQVTFATYGEASTFSLKDLWNTGYEEKGGMIYYV